MEILNQILPFTVSIITLIVGWIGGRRKSSAEVENIKADHAEKLLKLNDEYLIAPLTRKIDMLSKKNTAIRAGFKSHFRLHRREKLSSQKRTKKAKQMKSRGLRNNNLLNIRHNADTFQGEIKGADKSFKTFSSMAYGYRAAFAILATYLSRGLNTIEKIVNRWAPSIENHTENYVKTVEKYSGVPRDKELTSSSGADYILIVAAMSFVENEQNADISEVRAGFNLQSKITIQ